MGTAGYNLCNKWDNADSNCLIAKAAAELNAEYGRKLFSISQGVFQQPNNNLQRIEIDRAFKAADYANRRYPGTVESIIFTNEYFNNDSKGSIVFKMIRRNKDRAQRLGLKIGTRTHVGEHILDSYSPSFATLSYIAQNSDLILCNIYPTYKVSHFGIDRAVKEVTNSYLAIRECFIRINPQIKVMIGESGWASHANMFNGGSTSIENLVNYWNKLGFWATNNRIQIYLHEAIDQPWKGTTDGESHFGWWVREGDNFKEKANYLN
ncbi:hypothetical protein B4U79_17774 [Dinothrombium tinctorium]|uniref:glucan endo-1,3-beta-D-glucosidase n=1 Tax=Dinothrombium tinctorium TaxID=1965070 RepID=A0A3S5WGY6_9ACAR|nr:hypothetical protein B4U79_16163 [Dinothrombium tinctorium]RWS07114.1 hypothetical protein B4U79_16156 [Dinothrombium tinctorium]RWS07551.1 hypothetical protein B4U79_16129 [Dinothrombium tinctorium]RWS08396.1 hypothetical protein B4U79_17774 [Dinothrombium tinctorium]